MKALEMIKPPYSVQFYEIMIRIVQPLAKQLDSQQKSRSLIKQFLSKLYLIACLCSVSWTRAHYVLSKDDCPDGLTTKEGVEAMKAEIDEMDED